MHLSHETQIPCIFITRRNIIFDIPLPPDLTVVEWKKVNKKELFEDNITQQQQQRIINNAHSFFGVH